MNRRSFIRLTSAATLGIATAGCAGGAAYDERMLARPELLTALGAGPVRAIGKGYVTLPKAERDVASLREAILDARPLRARFLGAASPAIADLVRDDFAHGRTVVLNGWILSLTEARQCALFALLT